MGYIYIFITILLSVYGQLVLKWRLNLVGAMPETWQDKVQYFWHLTLDIWVISSFASAFLGSFTWVAALTKFDLSFAYPFMSLSFVFVLFLGYFLFQEPLTWQKLIGSLLIMAGIFLTTR